MKRLLGNYIQVSKLGQMLLIFPQIMASAVLPQVASGLDRAYVQKAILILSRLFSMLYLLILLIAFVFGRQFFPWVFGNSFQNMYYPFLLLLPGIFSLSILALLSAYFGGKGQVAVNVRGAFIALLFVAMADYFCIPLYGIYAAACISTIGYSINLVYALYIFHKEQPVSLQEIFAWRKADIQWLVSLLKTTKN